MTSTSAKIVFFGTETFSVTALAGLIDTGYSIAAVVTRPDSKKGRGQQLLPPEVKTLAQQHSIPVWQPTDIRAIADDIKALGPVTGVLVSFGRIIPVSIIDLFTPGIINLHPSLLPRYRGPSPIESSIKHGDEETGVSIMKLVAAMDAGPVYAQQTYLLNGTEIAPELYTTLAKTGTDLLVSILPQIMDGSLNPVEQDESQASYCQLLRKDESLIVPESMTATDAERQVRAYLIFPKSKLTFRDQEIVITKAHVSTQQKTPLDSLCQDGAYLCVDELITPNGRRTDAASFLRGYAA